jgi:small subunit ribosomal protein S3
MPPASAGSILSACPDRDGEHLHRKPGMIIAAAAPASKRSRRTSRISGPSRPPERVGIQQLTRTRSWWPRISPSSWKKRISFRRALSSSAACHEDQRRQGRQDLRERPSGGADIARGEHYHDGSIPLQTLRAQH